MNARLPSADQLRLDCAVTSIERTPHGVIVHDSHGKQATYVYGAMRAADISKTTCTSTSPRKTSPPARCW